MYFSNYSGPSQAEQRANNRSRYTTLLASISMLSLGISLGTTGPTAASAQPGAQSIPSVASAAGNAAVVTSSTGNLRPEHEEPLADEELPTAP